MTHPSDLVIDDHLLVRVLLDDEPADLRPEGARLHTTGLWYHRLCRSLADDAVVGPLSRALGPVDRTTGSGVLGSVVALPAPIGLCTLRDLAWPMAELLRDGHRLNLMSLEALAAAERVDAELCLTPADDNPPLRRAARARGRMLRIVEG